MAKQRQIGMIKGQILLRATLGSCGELYASKLNAATVRPAVFRIHI